MKEHPILFSSPMVRAILEGRKTQTRRVVKLNAAGRVAFKGRNWHLGDPEATLACPQGQPGDRLWVRETTYVWGKMVKNGLNKKGKQKWSFKTVGQKSMYTDNPPAIVLGPKSHDREGWFRRPSIFMPRWASRILLEVTDVRVQRVQEISEEDAKAEGCWWNEPSPTEHGYTTKARFQELWDSINAKRGFGWDVNPWVWAITFRRIA